MKKHWNIIEYSCGYDIFLKIQIANLRRFEFGGKTFEYAYYARSKPSKQTRHDEFIRILILKQTFFTFAGKIRGRIRKRKGFPGSGQSMAGSP